VAVAEARAGPILYLVRHGETAWNREGRVQGHLDSPLTARGIVQARQVGATLAALLEGEQPVALVASPLGRTRHTAELMLEALGGRVAAVRFDDRLKEIGWGRWEGLTRSEIAAREPATFAAHQRDPWTVGPPGGESWAMLSLRVAAWLESVGQEPRLVVVGHGAWGRALRGLWLGQGPEATLALEQPQDAIFRLATGTVARIGTDD
jgi:broad specificity phosphatase PhoE